MNKVYAGIGSRRVPEDIRRIMKRLATALAREGYQLNTGAAEGSDQAFLRGAIEYSPAPVQVYLPWADYEIEFLSKRKTVAHEGLKKLITSTGTQEQKIAQRFHPAYNQLGRAAKLLITRNTSIVLGTNPSDETGWCDFVICWTPSGGMTGREHNSGGTGQALRIANAYKIPVWNLGKLAHYNRADRFLKDTSDTAYRYFGE